MVFNRIYDFHNNYDSSLGITQTLDNGYIVAGNTLDFTTGYSALLIIKLNISGDTLWHKEFDFGTLGSDKGSDIIQLKDSSYIITGASYDTIQQRRDAFIVRLDLNGNLIWFKKYGDIYNDVGYQIKEVHDGGYIMAGWSEQPNGFEDAYLVKTDSAGNMQWSQHYGFGNSDLIYSVDLTPDGGYILGGTTYNNIPGTGTNTPPNMYLIKTDSLGVMQWQKPYGEAGMDNGLCVISSLDGGYLLAGAKETPVGSGLNNAFAVKTDSSGNVQWTKLIGSNNINEVFFAARQLPDSSYFVAGTYGYGQFDGCLVKLDVNGDTIFTRTYRFFPDTGTYQPQHYFYNMNLTEDGGVVMCGMTINNPLPQKNDVWVVKVDSLGCADTSCAITTGVAEGSFSNPNTFFVYPNPVKENSIILSYRMQAGHVLTAGIYDINGRLVKTERITIPGNYHPVSLPVLNAGVYCIHLQDRNSVYTWKFVKE